MFETRYHHVPQSESLNQFIAEKIKVISRRFENRGDGVKMTFQIDQAHHTREGKTDLFLVEGILHRPRRASLVVKKENENVHRGVGDVIQVLEKMLRRESETGEHGRKIVGRTHTPARTAKLQMAERATPELNEKLDGTENVELGETDVEDLV